MSPAPNPSATPPRGVSRERQAALLRALRDAGQDGLTWDAMARALRAPVRAAERAMAALLEDGAEVESEWTTTARGKRKRYVLRTPPRWEAALTREARLALGVAELALDRVGSELWVEHLKALERVFEDAMGHAWGEAVRERMQRLDVRGTVKRGSAKRRDVLLALLDALALKPLPPDLEVRYRHSEEAEAHAVQVVPHSLTHDAFAGATYLLAWDLDRDRPWNFRLSRIEGVRAGRPGVLAPSRRAGLDRAAKFQIGAWVQVGEPFVVKVRIKGAHWVRHFLETPPGLPEVQVEPRPPGRPRELIVTFKANGLDGPDRWVLQMGGAAEVVEPEALRESVARQLESALAGYRTGPEGKTKG